MKIRSLYKNLDTVFVDLSALLRHLRHADFIGVVRVEIAGYKAEVVFDEQHHVRMREFGKGFIDTESGIKRLLAQSKAPGGMINVFEAIIPERKTAKEELSDILDLDNRAENGPAAKPASQSPAPKIPKPAEKVFVYSENGFTSGSGNGNGNGHSKNGFHTETPVTGESLSEDIFPIYSHTVDVVEDQPEMKNKVSSFSPQEWEELIETTAALLGVIDSILKAAQLGFPDAFMKSRVEVSNEYPFLHPLKGIFRYEDGKATLTQEVPPNLLVSGVSECLRRILNKLISNPKFFAVYKRITQQVLILVRQRQPQFDKFGYTRQLERIIKF